MVGFHHYIEKESHILTENRSLLAMPFLPPKIPKLFHENIIPASTKSSPHPGHIPMCPSNEEARRGREHSQINQLLQPENNGHLAEKTKPSRVAGHAFSAIFNALPL
jgi:hypothetical protein